MKKYVVSLVLAAITMLGACTHTPSTPMQTQPQETQIATQEEEIIETQGETQGETQASTSVDTQVETQVQTSDETEKETLAEELPVKTFQNPLLQDRAAPDPYVIYHDGYYYATFTEALGIALYRSQSLETLYTDEKISVTNLTEQIQGNVWAPELHYYPPTDRWYIYACGSTNGWEFGSMRMFCLESTTSNPFGEYVFKGYTEPNVLAIDQTVYYDEASQTLYTAYSEFTSLGQVIKLAVMENPWTISNKRIRVSYPTYDWEKQGATANKDERVNEGPVFLCHNGQLSLIYSASGCWSEYYCLGLLEFQGDDFSIDEMMNRNNWKKHETPIFSAANEVYGVGHCNFFTSPDGTETWISYHGMPTPDAGEDGRYAYAQKITFDENNLPICGEPLSRDTKIPVPSGEK